MKTKRFFITGTSTDVGKTYVACALLKNLNEQGFQTAALKPVASGGILTSEGLQNQDALDLQKAASLRLNYKTVNPILFEPPIAPHIAAELAGSALNVDTVLKACSTALNTPADYLIIEGAGGWLVPLNHQESFADLAEKLEAEIILVVGMQLGCINHALLTVDNILKRGLTLKGWIANCIDPDMLNLNENIETLKHRIKAPLLAILPYNIVEEWGQV